MQYKVGDKVKFLNDIGGGTITKIVSKNMVHVENEDGFEIPTITAEIVLVGEISSNSLSKEEGNKPKPTITDFVRQGMQEVLISENSEKKEITIAGNNKPFFYLAFVPENNQNPLDGTIRVYIINDSSYTLIYNYSQFNGFNYTAKQSGIIEANTKIIIDNLSSIDVTKLPDFAFQIIFFKDGASNLETPISKQININTVKFYKSGSFKKTDYFASFAMLYKLNESELDLAIDKLIEEKDFPPKIEDAKFKLNHKKQEVSEIMEVDLHIHELVDNERGLEPKDMLSFQMKTFNEKMEEAITSNKVKKIVFIHGLGNGVLKNEVRRELNRKYRKYDFQDASFQEYGYGATMVILRRK